MINLNERFPELGVPQIQEALVQEFRNQYLEDPRLNPFEHLDVSREEALGVPEVASAYHDLRDTNFIFNKQGEFTNSFEKKFDWGLVDVNFDVKNGKIVSAMIYSDSLVPEFIHSVEKRLREGDVEYSKNGIRKILDLDLRALPHTSSRHLEELVTWVADCIE